VIADDEFWMWLTVTCDVFCFPVSSDVPRNFVRGEVQQIQLMTEDRENGDLGAVAP